MFPSGRRSLPEQCSCRARSHPKRDGSRYLPWLWSVKLLVPLFSSSSPQTKETLPLMLCQAVAFPLSPLPLSHPFAVCSSMLTAAQGHCQQPPGLVPPSHWCDREEHVWELSQGQARQAGETRVSLLLLWLLGMFLSRTNSVPRLPVFVFSNVSAIKISGLGWCEMNFGGVLKPWL